METPNIDDFAETILEAKKDTYVDSESREAAKADIINHLTTQINQTAIIEMSESKINELAKLIDQPDFTPERLSDFIKTSGVDLSRITFDTMERFRKQYLGAEA